MAEAIDKKYLAGLVYRSSKQKKGDKGKVNIPTERPLTVADVLSWKDNGATVTVVTADGRKHSVSKSAKVKDEDKKEGKE